MNQDLSRPRIFLHALAAALDAPDGPAGGGPPGRDSLLRDVGRRMAALMPVNQVASMAELELEMNDALAAIGWGQGRMALREAERCLVISHVGLPRIGARGEPAGAWLAAALEGLYEGWMAQQPGADPTLSARRQPTAEDGVLELHYMRR